MRMLKVTTFTVVKNAFRAKVNLLRKLAMT